MDVAEVKSPCHIGSRFRHLDLELLAASAFYIKASKISWHEAASARGSQCVSEHLIWTLTIAVTKVSFAAMGISRARVKAAVCAERFRGCLRGTCLEQHFEPGKGRCKSS